MDRDAFNAFCASLAATDHVIQWGGSDVWKVGGKVFAIAGWSDNDAGNQTTGITFKTTELSFEILKAQEGLRPAPYLASRGFSWIQHYAEPGLNDDELQGYLRASHQLVAKGLSRKRRIELGLETEEST